MLFKEAQYPSAKVKAVEETRELAIESQTEVCLIWTEPDGQEAWCVVDPERSLQSCLQELETQLKNGPGLERLSISNINPEQDHQSLARELLNASLDANLRIEVYTAHRSFFVYPWMPIEGVHRSLDSALTE